MLLVPLAEAAPLDNVCFAGVGVDAPNNEGFRMISATVSFSSLPVPKDVFLYNWIGATSKDSNGNNIFFQIVLASPPNPDTVGLAWFVGLPSGTGSNIHNVYSSLSLSQTYDLEMVFDGSNWQLGFNGVTVYSFAWPYPANTVMALTETWYANGILPNVGTSDFTNLQVETSKGYIPLLALPANNYAVTHGATSYNSTALYNGEIALSDSHIQTGFGYPVLDPNVIPHNYIPTFQGDASFSNTSYFGVQPLREFPIPTPTPFANIPTPYSTVSPSPRVTPFTGFPTVAPKNSPTDFITNNVFVFAVSLVGVVAIAMTLAFAAKNRKHGHRR